MDSDCLLTGRRLTLARSIWASFVVLYLALFVLGIRPGFERALVLAPESQFALAARGFAPNFPALYWLTLDTLTFGAFAAIALFIVWRRPSDWLVMLTSLMLIGTGTLYTVPPAEASLPIPLTALAFGVAEICQILFLYVFPDGKFVPRRIWIFLIPLVVWRPAIWGLVYLPDFYLTTRTGDNYGTLRQDALDIGLLLALLIGGIISQIYRYRRVSTLEQRQQTKWLLFGMIGTLSVVSLYVLLVNVFGLLEGAGGVAVFQRMVGRTVRQIALLMLPFTLFFSILRYRLWDIDVLIRRTLVYAPLTALMAGLIAALVTLSKSLTLGVIGQNSIFATLGITLIAVAVGEPLKDWIQRGVDARFKYAPAPDVLMQKFAERVEHRLSLTVPDQLVRRFCDEAVTTFEASGGAAYLADGTTLRRVYVRGDVERELITIPVLGKTGRLGAIALGRRPFHRAYDRADSIALGRAANVVARALEQDWSNS